ncbi:globin domain-containing protein [Bosea sp. PAMC 26642]|uniref:globin domain-containing protein n=1 Tax=Bosea sp. (strain PAMC 26642) TaxID=1792307 RepID=UPI0014390E65|nr:globin domain-containing protein [Bosea sp. PAMC 26642]
MRADDIALVRESFAHLHRRKAETATLFYGRLFEIAAETLSLFKGDMSTQGVKLMEMLTVAIATLNDRDGLTTLLKRLGRNHKSYGVHDEHYAKIREALLWTMKTSLGPAHTPEVAHAWAALYDHIAAIMMDAGRAT